jgi:hypothetical protein
MAQTAFIAPTTVTQLAGTDTVAWDLDSGMTPHTQDGNCCGTTEPLRAVSMPTGLTGQRQTHMLLWSGWNLSSVSGTVMGIELRVHAEKSSRVQDHVIQLYRNGSLIGANRASSTAGDDHVYGSSTDTWGTALTVADLATLQVAVTYQSGALPHSDHAYVDTVQLRITYTP